MREKPDIHDRGIAVSQSRSRRIRCDLEDRGVTREFSHSVAERLTTIAPDLSASEYVAVLDGVAAAYGVHREACCDAPDSQQQAQDVSEIERLMKGFGAELRKLEEGLQILSAYVVRMGNRAGNERRETLH
jgi:hypothetical protein